jgi:type II secretory pathway component GspD/PulD (secretin)
MRIKELSILAGSGILSLAALLILETGGDTAPTDEPAPAASFEDSSSLVEYAPPAPTAEPPAKPAANPQGGSGSVYVSVGGGEPVRMTPAQVAEAQADAQASSESAPAPAPSAPPAPAPTAPAAAPDAGTTATATAENTEGGLSERFKKAVATATKQAGSVIGTVTPAAKGSPGKDAAATEAPVQDGAVKEGAGKGSSEENQVSVIEETAGGFWLKSAKLNDVFQHLAQLANMQYFHNTEIEGPNFVVTGQLMDDDPVKQMEELALMYGITIHQKGNTVYALNSSQLSQLPTEPFRYQLKYLRPKDIEQIKLILQPFLTTGSGIIEYETKTNTLIVMDNERKLDALALFLEQIDQPKQQIAIETRILRVTSDSKNQVGVDWSSVLGDEGIALNSATSLNALFNLPDLATAAEFISATDDGNSFTTNNVTASGNFRAEGDTGGSGSTVLSPLQLTAVLRALEAGGLAEQESSPTLITEDNEEGLISIIDRIPIVTSTVTINNGASNITDVVRYKIDEEDQAGDPTTTREVGVSVAVTPTILPDSTIRMSLRPRSAQVTEYVTTPSGNLYPRVNESSVTTTARVPNGHSLLIGGFYEETSEDVTNKVPILGDVPAVSLLFKSTVTEKKNTSLVFIITPKLYRPELALENDTMAHELHDAHVLPKNHDYPNRFKPGANYRSNLKNSVKNAFNRYEPDPAGSLLLPEHPYNRPEAVPSHAYPESGEPSFVQAGDAPEVTVRPVSESRKGGFLGKIFGGNKKGQVP